MNIQKKVALVTGANRGLGLETAKQLARAEVIVIASARDQKKLKDTNDQFVKEGTIADYLKLDVTNDSDIQNAVAYITDTYGKLDILINNAGISKEKSTSHVVNTSQDVEINIIKEVYATNLFGVISLTQLMLPLLRKSDEARIVNLSSELGSLNLHADINSHIFKLKKFAYNSSKTALNQFTIHLAELLSDTKIKVNAVSPGWVKTDMGTQYAPLEIIEGVKIIIEAAMLPSNGPSGTFFTHQMRQIAW